MNVIFLKLLCTVAFALISQSAFDDLDSGERKLSAFEYENTRLKQTNSVLFKALLKLTASDSQTSIPSMKCSKVDSLNSLNDSYVSFECLEEFIKLVYFLNSKSCLANDMSQRLAEAYIPLNACVNVSRDYLARDEFGSTGLKKFSCDSKKLMAEPCDSIEYSSLFAAILSRPSNASYGDEQNQTIIFGWGLCTTQETLYGRSLSMNCVDGFVNQVFFDDDKCSSKTNTEIKNMNVCVGGIGYPEKFFMMCNEEMVIQLACTNNSFALPLDMLPPLQDNNIFGCKNHNNFDGYSTDYFCNITTNVLEQYEYDELNCTAEHATFAYELDKKCVDLGPTEYFHWNRYTTTTSNCHTFYKLVPCFAHDSNWTIYGPDDFVCDINGKNCTTKKNYRPLTLTEVTSTSIPKYELMCPNVTNAIAGGGKRPNKGSSKFNTKKLVVVSIIVVCLALTGASLAYYYCCTGNKKANETIQPRLGYESMD